MQINSETHVDWLLCILNMFSNWCTSEIYMNLQYILYLSANPNIGNRRLKFRIINHYSHFDKELYYIVRIWFIVSHDYSDWIQNT